MKKVILMAAAFCLPFTASFAQNQPNETVSYKKVGSGLPELRIVEENGQAHTNAELKGERGSMLIMFNPTCDHCVVMAKAICENHEKFQHVPIAFMAGPSLMSYLGFFFQETNLKDCPSLVVGVDSTNAANQLFLFQSLPQINIYDKDQKLVKIFTGDVPVDSLTYYLKP